MKPSVGRIVHYVSYGTPGGEYASECRAAVIAAVGAWRTVREGEPHHAGQDPDQPLHRDITQEWDPEACGLVVLNPTGQFFNACEHDELPPADKVATGERTAHRPGTWHWPERVED